MVELCDNIDTKCSCGKDSTKGCHGFKNDELYSEYFCDPCFNKRNGKVDKNENLADSIQED